MKSKPTQSQLTYLLSTFVLILIVNLLSWGLAEWLLLGDFRKLEQLEAQHEFQRLQAAFERESDFLQRWGASRAVRLQEVSPESPDLAAQVREKVPLTILEAANIDFLAVRFARIEQQIIISNPISLDVGPLRRREVLTGQIQAMIPALNAVGDRSGLLWVGDNLAICATVPLVSAAPAEGSLLVLRLLDEETLDHLSTTLQLDFSFPPHTLSPDTGNVPDLLAGIRTTVVDDNRLLIAGAFPELAESGAVGVELSLPRVIYPQGLRMVRFYQLWLGGLSLALGIVIWPVMNRLRSKRDQERLLNRMVRESGEALFLVRPNGEVVLSNPKAAQLVGLPHDSVLGLPLDDLLGLKSDPQTWEKIFTGGQERDAAPLTLRFVNRQGQQVVGEAVCSHLNFAGEEQLLLQVRDVGWREASEKALKAASERYRLLFENNPLPMWVYQRETLRFMAVNEAAIAHYMYTREEFLAMSIRDIRPAEDVPAVEDAVRATAPGLTYAGVWKHRKKDGTLIDVEVTLYALNFDGQPANLVLLNDVTEQFRLRQESERVARLAALGELAAGVAHEINNPNGMILRNLGFIDDVLNDALPLLSGRDGAGPQLGGLDYEQVCAQVPLLVDDMRRGAGHIRDIVRDMKDFARFDEPADKDLFDFNQAVAAAVRLLEGPIRKSTDAFELQLGDDLPMTPGSHRQIEQVVVNLVLNACQALPERSLGVKVRTRFEAARQRNVLEVIDEGKGIARENLARVTDPFFTTRREQGGTGLGLSVSARIVKQHRGVLDFRSEPGKGTHVTLTLPVS